MSKYLRHLPSSLFTLVREIGRVADRAGIGAYLVGGIVRDIILRRKNLDLDIVVEADAKVFAQKLAKKFKAKVTIHDAFGTASLILPSHLRIDLATARKEYYPYSGALPVVEKGSFRDDLFRRDFTINAMAVCINRDAWDELVDPYGGLLDLKEGRIRILHKESFKDDPTRLLRAVRFEQRFNFKIEKETLALLKEAINEGYIQNVKPHRHFVEFKKLLNEPDPLRNLKRLAALKAVKINFSRAAQVHRYIQQLPAKHFAGLNKDKWFLYCLAVLEKVNSGAKFPFRKEERRSIQEIKKKAAIFRGLSVRRLNRSEIYKILNRFSWYAIFYWAATASEGRVLERLERFLRHDSRTRLQINGDDLKRLGLNTGREIGRILNEILYQKIDGRIRTRQQALKLAEELIGKI